MTASRPKEPSKEVDELASHKKQLSWLPVPPGYDFYYPEMLKSTVSWAQESDTQLSHQPKYKLNQNQSQALMPVMSEHNHCTSLILVLVLSGVWEGQPQAYRWFNCIFFICSPKTAN